jgi:hypothetical protein
MRREKDVERLIRRTRFKAGVNLHNRTITDALEAQANSKETESAGSQSRIWRTVMRNRITKLTAAVFVVAVLAGVYQLGGTHAAFARTTKMVRTSLAGLREFVLEMRTRQPDRHIYEANLPPARPDTQSSDILHKHVIARAYVFSAEGQQQNLWDFFEREDIKLAPVKNNGDALYAELDPDKAERFTGFAGAGDDLKLMSSPSLMLIEGEEGVIGVSGAEDQDVLALALVVTALDDSKHIELSLSFLQGQSGFEISSLRLKIDKAVLFRFVTTAETEGNSKDGSDGEGSVFVLIRIEVISPT